eukprot:1157652-Pelagomonas_calceolata.AAC.24
MEYNGRLQKMWMQLLQGQYFLNLHWQGWCMPTGNFKPRYFEGEEVILFSEVTVKLSLGKGRVTSCTCLSRAAQLKRKRCL